MKINSVRWIRFVVNLSSMKNRLLQTIRQQQAQLQQMQLQIQQNSITPAGTAIVDELTPASERSASFPTIPPLPTPVGRSSAQHSAFLTRRESRTSNHQTSPSLRPVPSGHSSLIDPPHGSELPGLGGPDLGVGHSARRSSRDESSFYQAEAAMLSRENQMLRARIRELGKYKLFETYYFYSPLAYSSHLERQISELKAENHIATISATTLLSGNAANEPGNPIAQEGG